MISTQMLLAQADRDAQVVKTQIAHGGEAKKPRMSLSAKAEKKFKTFKTQLDELLDLALQIRDATIAKQPTEDLNDQLKWAIDALGEE